MLTRNRKMKNSSNENSVVFNFTLPAFRSGNIQTCPNAGACAAGCYAQMGAYVWDNVKKAHKRNLDSTLMSTFVVDMSRAIETKLKTAKRKGKQLYIRIHDSGDFYSLEYKIKWFSIIKQFPEVKFYAYTKEVNEFKKLTLLQWIPSNLTLIYSLGGKQDASINMEYDRHARVFENEDLLNAAGYVNASSDDLLAIGENKKIGLVYHGNKSFKNTLWKKTSSVT